MPQTPQGRSPVTQGPTEGPTQGTKTASRAPKERSAEIRLLGQRIVLKCNEKDPELVDETVQLVSRLIRNAELRGKAAAAHQVALLALLDLAEEYVRAKRRTASYKKGMVDKADRLLSAIEAQLK